MTCGPLSRAPPFPCAPEEMALQEAEGFYSLSTPHWTEWEVQMDITVRATKGRPSKADASTRCTAADLLPLLNLAGSTRLGDGSIRLPDGRIVDTTGAIKERDGTIRFPDGSILLPSGDLIFTDGSSMNIHSSSSHSRKSSYDLGQGEFQLDIDMRYPPGTTKQEDGYHLPNGMIVTDEYVKMPDGCIKWHREERCVFPLPSTAAPILGDACIAFQGPDLTPRYDPRGSGGGINGRYRATECPRHRQCQPLVQRFSQDSSCTRGRPGRVLVCDPPQPPPPPPPGF